jgi:hypothetical protein
MNSEPDNKLTLEWIKRPDGAVALRFDPRTLESIRGKRHSTRYLG